MFGSCLTSSVDESSTRRRYGKGDSGSSACSPTATTGDVSTPGGSELSPDSLRRLEYDGGGGGGGGSGSGSGSGLSPNDTAKPSSRPSYALVPPGDDIDGPDDAGADDGDDDNGVVDVLASPVSKFSAAAASRSQELLPGSRYAIDVFHDGETCPVRMSTNGSRLFDVVISSVLDAIGQRMDIVGDIDTLCDVKWRFVLPIGDSRFFPTKALKELLDKGVIHINPGTKKGAIDALLSEGLDRLCSERANDSPSDKQRRVVVLISSDRDFAAPLQRLRHCDLRTVLIFRGHEHTPSRHSLGHTHQAQAVLAAHSLGIWEEIVDETEMDATDLYTLSKRFSFRMQPVLRDSSAEASERNDDDDDDANDDDVGGAGGGDEDDETRTALGAMTRREPFSASTLLLSDGAHDHSAVVPEEEQDIPDFKFACAKDLYLFLLGCKHFTIDVHNLHLFWTHYPQHRHEIGRVRNFCQSAKAEGAFTYSESGNGGHMLSIVPPHLRKKPLVMSMSPVGSHGHSRVRRPMRKKGSKLAATDRARRAAGGSPGSHMRSPRTSSDRGDSSSEQSGPGRSSSRGSGRRGGVDADDVVKSSTVLAHAMARRQMERWRRSVVEVVLVACVVLTLVAGVYLYLYQLDALHVAWAHIGSSLRHLHIRRLEFQWAFDTAAQWAAHGASGARRAWDATSPDADGDVPIVTVDCGAAAESSLACRAFAGYIHIVLRGVRTLRRENWASHFQLFKRAARRAWQARFR